MTIDLTDEQQRMLLECVARSRRKALAQAGDAGRGARLNREARTEHASINAVRDRLADEYTEAQARHKTRADAMTVLLAKLDHAIASYRAWEDVSDE